MHFRDGKSQLIHHTIVRISSAGMINDSGPSLEAWCKYRRVLRLSSRYSFRVAFHSISGLNPREDDANYLEFSRELGMVLLELKDPQYLTAFFSDLEQ